MRTYYLNTFDSTPLCIHAWDEVTEPRGLILACHDVGDHSGRWQDLADSLGQDGYVLIGYDQRGFGATAPCPEALGQGDGNTFAYSVQDVIFLYRYFARQYGLPICLLGIGYGGYVVLGALQHDIIHPAGVMLMSMGLISNQALRAALTMVRSIPVKERVTRMALIQPDPQADGAENAVYNDPLTGVIPTATFDKVMLEGLLSVMAGSDRWDNRVPYALFAGMADPILGKEGQLAVDWLLLLRRLGFDPRFFGYEDVGHDILHSVYAQRCHGHILRFLNSLPLA